VPDRTDPRAREAATEQRLHLASASPRRREILRALGVDHTFAGVDIDETPRTHEPPAELVLRLALAKARTSRARHQDRPVILGADTVVSLDGQVFGKPASRTHALEMLSRLSGRAHTVLTAVVVIAGEREWSAVASSSVRFREIEPREAVAYWQTGEPVGKAGAYAIQGKGGIFVESIAGSFSCIVGLPVFETARLLQGAGIPILGTLRD
jgi:septum formation protein